LTHAEVVFTTSVDLAMDASVRSALAALRGRLNGQLLVPLVGLEKPLR